MFDKLLPQRIDNTYRGYKLATLAVWIGRGRDDHSECIRHLQRLLDDHERDGIPLDTYRPQPHRQLGTLGAKGAVAPDHLFARCTRISAISRAIPFMFALLC